MTMNKLHFSLFALILLLIFGCGSFENDPKPVGTSEETVNINIGRTIRSGEFEQRVESEQIPQNNCEGKSSFSFSVNRERTLEQSIDLTLQGEVGGEVELAGKPMEVGIAGKIIAAIGAAYSQSNSKSITDSGGMEFTIEAGDFPTYIIVWREKWEKGYIEVEYNDEDLQVPYLYLTTARPELVNVEYKNCETGQPIQSTSQENVTVETAEDLELQPTDTPISTKPPSTTNSVVTGFRLCNRDDAGKTFAQTDSSTGATRIIILPSAQVFFLSTDPTTITFSPNSGLSPISSNSRTQYVIIGKNVPGLEWIEINPGFSYTACIYSLDQFDRAKYEADNDMTIKKAGNSVSEYYSIDGQNIKLIESFP